MYVNEHYQNHIEMKYVLFFLFLLSTFSTHAQFTPSIVLDTIFQTKLRNKLLSLDKYILTDKSNYYNDDKTLYGFGQKNSDCYSIKVTLKDDETEIQTIEVKKLRSKDCKVIDYKEFLSLSSDSLNLKSREDTYVELSHGYYWSLMVVYHESFKVIQAYSPEVYQKIAPVKEREYFLEQFKILEN